MDKSNNNINILGIELSTLKKQEIKKVLEVALFNQNQLFVTTPNPEIVLNANNDEEYHYILNNADLSIPDGFGLVIASIFMPKRISRWPGSDLVLWILHFAEIHNYKIAILNLQGGLSSNNDIEKSLREYYPHLSFIVENVNKEWSPNIQQRLDDFEPNIVFTSLGSPQQEKFLYKNKHKMAYVSILIGVGGSFDYITGKVKSSPQVFKKFGLEWLWRLINISDFTYPIKRLKRIAKATILFPLLFIKWKFINPFIYRKNVACMLYKKENNKYYVLVLERKDEAGHFQIPQGGTDGESLEKGGARELEEEVGTFNFQSEKTYPDLFKYSFKNTNNGNNQFKFRNYKGQTQGLLIAKFTGTDSDIKLEEYEHSSWKWVNLELLEETIHPVRQVGIRKFIKKFNQYIKTK